MHAGGGVGQGPHYKTFKLNYITTTATTLNVTFVVTIIMFFPSFSPLLLSLNDRLLSVLELSSVLYSSLHRGRLGLIFS